MKKRFQSSFFSYQKQKKIFVACIAAVICCLLSYKHSHPKDSSVCFQANCFNVEIAKTQEELTRGLMFRKALGKKEGMLFVFPLSASYSFWMKNTIIPLDIIWLDDAWRVVHIEHQVPPCQIEVCPSYTSKKAALYVLEINAGEARRIGLQEGDELKFYSIHK